MNLITLKNLLVTSLAALVAGGWIASLPPEAAHTLEALLPELANEDGLPEVAEPPSTGELLQLLDPFLPEFRSEDVAPEEGAAFSALYTTEFTLEEAGTVEPLELEFIGDGHSALLGSTALRFGGAINLTERPFPTSGIIALMDTQGDQLFGRVVGQSIPEETNDALLRLRFDAIFGGGTGKFRSAAGLAKVTGAAYFLTGTKGTAAWNIEGRLSLKKAVEITADAEIEINEETGTFALLADGFQASSGAPVAFVMEGEMDLETIPYHYTATATLTDAEGNQWSTGEESVSGWVMPQGDGLVLRLDHSLHFGEGTGAFAGSSGRVTLEGATVFLESRDGYLLGSASIRLRGGRK